MNVSVQICLLLYWQIPDSIWWALERVLIQTESFLPHSPSHLATSFPFSCSLLVAGAIPNHMALSRRGPNYHTGTTIERFRTPPPGIARTYGSDHSHANVCANYLQMRLKQGEPLKWNESKFAITLNFAKHLLVSKLCLIQLLWLAVWRCRRVGMPRVSSFFHWHIYMRSI